MLRTALQTLYHLAMISLRPELEQLASENLLTPEEARLLIAFEDREIVSVHAQLRFLLWAGAALIVGGVGFWFAANLDRLGPALVTAIGAVLAAAAWAGSYWLQRRSATHPSLAAEYLGLLGALLLSADVAWAESQFAIFANWKHHLLILTVVHAAFAYLFANRLVLAVAVTSFAAWFGVDRDELFDLSGFESGLRLLAASIGVLVWRLFHLSRPMPRFETILEHATVQLAFWAALVWIARDETRWIGLALLILAAACVVLWAFRSEGRDLHVVWASIYTLIGVDIIILDNFNNEIFGFLWLTVSSLAAVFGLVAFFISRRRSQ